MAVMDQKELRLLRAAALNSVVEKADLQEQLDREVREVKRLKKDRIQLAEIAVRLLTGDKTGAVDLHEEIKYWWSMDPEDEKRINKVKAALSPTVAEYRGEGDSKED